MAERARREVVGGREECYIYWQRFRNRSSIVLCDYLTLTWANSSIHQLTSNKYARSLTHTHIYIRSAKQQLAASEAHLHAKLN